MKRPEIEDRIRIDRDDLDNELVDQPELLFHAYNGFLMAGSRRDAFKEDQIRADAEIADEWTEGALREGKKPPSQAAITRQLSTERRHIEARDRYLDACADTDKWQALKEAIVSRGMMLRELAQMQTARLYGGRESVGVSDVQADRIKQAMAEKRGGRR